jgi:hypothetical protein
VTRSELLAAATDAVDRRPKSYGPPEQNFERIAALWDVYFSLKPGTTSVGPVDVANLMILMKVARLIETPTHDDSWVDIAGYAACGAEVAASDSQNSVS